MGFLTRNQRLQAGEPNCDSFDCESAEHSCPSRSHDYEAVVVSKSASVPLNSPLAKLPCVVYYETAKNGIERLRH